MTTVLIRARQEARRKEAIYLNQKEARRIADEAFFDKYGCYEEDAIFCRDCGAFLGSRW